MAGYQQVDQLMTSIRDGGLIHRKAFAILLLTTVGRDAGPEPKTLGDNR
jgi:hypothetical protein